MEVEKSSNPADLWYIKWATGLEKERKKSSDAATAAASSGQQVEHLEHETTCWHRFINFKFSRLKPPQHHTEWLHVMGFPSLWQPEVKMLRYKHGSARCCRHQAARPLTVHFQNTFLLLGFQRSMRLCYIVIFHCSYIVFLSYVLSWVESSPLQLWWTQSGATQVEF